MPGGIGFLKKRKKNSSSSSAAASNHNEGTAGSAPNANTEAEDASMTRFDSSFQLNMEATSLGIGDNCFNMEPVGEFANGDLPGVQEAGERTDLEYGDFNLQPNGSSFYKKGPNGNDGEINTSNESFVGISKISDQRRNDGVQANRRVEATVQTWNPSQEGLQQIQKRPPTQVVDPSETRHESEVEKEHSRSRCGAQNGFASSVANLEGDTGPEVASFSSSSKIDSNSVEMRMAQVLAQDLPAATTGKPSPAPVKVTPTTKKRFSPPGNHRPSLLADADAAVITPQGVSKQAPQPTDGDITPMDQDANPAGAGENEEFDVCFQEFVLHMREATDLREGEDTDLLDNTASLATAASRALELEGELLDSLDAVEEQEDCSLELLREHGVDIDGF